MVDLAGVFEIDPTTKRYISRKDPRVTIEYSDQDKHWELKRCEAIWLRAQRRFVFEARVGEGVDVDGGSFFSFCGLMITDRLFVFLACERKLRRKDLEGGLNDRG